MRTMKKYAFLVAAAAMGFTACSKDEVAEVKNEPSFKLTIEASADETRSAFGDKDETVGYLSNWSGTESVWFYMGEGTTGVKATPAAAGSSTTFDVTFTGTAPESGIIYALSPVGDFQSTPKKGGFTSNTLTTTNANSFVVIPSEQTPLAGSCDESVHLLAATQEFSGSIASPLQMKFNHVAAYGKMTITNFTAGTIASVTITSPVAIVGSSCKYYYKTGELNSASDKSITLKADNVTDNVFWFGCAPAALTSGTMTVAVTDTEGKRYVKEITLTAEKGIKLTQGRVAAFSVNMEGIAAEETPSQIIADGDYVIAVESKNVMMTVGTASQTYRGYRTLSTTKVDDKLVVDPDAIWTINYTADKGYTIKSYSENTYLSWNSGNTASLTSSEYYVNINAVDGGGYNIVASTDSNRLLAYNSGSPRFAFYSNSQERVLQIIPAYVDTTPSFKVNPTNLNIPAAGTDGMTITVTDVKNFGENYTVSASSDNTQFTTYVSDNTVTVTAPANETDAAIEGTITITVTDGTNTLTDNVTVSQAAAGTSTPKYVKVTSAPTDWSGTYLIVYEASGTEGRVFSGIVGNNNNLQVTIDNDTIAVTDDIKKLEIEIATMEGGYSLKCPSGYMYGTSGSNVVSFNTETPQLNTIEYNDTDKSTKITSNTSVFRFNPIAGQMRFRYFKSTTYTSQGKVQLYKLEN